MASIPNMPDLCDVYRPFGAVSPVHASVPCRIVPRLASGRGGYVSTNYLQWSHWADVPAATDVRDGSSRAAGTTIISYADGDGVSATLGGIFFTWVVVWVEVRFSNTPAEYKRAYLMRDGVTW